MLLVLLFADPVQASSATSSKAAALSLWELLGCAALAALWRWVCGSGGSIVASLPTAPEQLAFLASGQQRAMDVALVRMLMRGEIRVDTGEQLQRDPLSRPDQQDGLADLIWRQLYRPLNLSELGAASAPYWHQMAAQLRSRGLLCSTRSESRRHLAWLLVPVWVCVHWSASPGQIAFGAAAVAILLGIVLAPRLGTARAASKLIRDCKSRQERLATAPCPDEYPLAVALFGLDAVAGTSLQPYLDMRKRRKRSEHEVEAGCGDSSGDSGGDGGGDGGGGCGD